MKKLKKVLSVIMFVIMTMIMTISTASAVETDVIDGISLYLLSGDVPESAIDYGRLCFSNLSADQLMDCGFSYEEIINLRLAPAVTAYEYDACDSPYYFFPVLCRGNVVAMLTVIDKEDGTYSCQFGKSEFANSLNELNTSQNNPSILVMTEKAMFALDCNDNLTVVETYTVSSEQKLRSTVVNTPSVTFETASTINHFKVVVEDGTAYNEVVNCVSPRAARRNSLSVPIVANGSNTLYPSGYCWASALASIIKISLRNPPLPLRRFEIDLLTRSMCVIPMWQKVYWRNILVSRLLWIHLLQCLRLKNV
ncbi:MAG: hypothetical protein K2N06_09720 [Oscillospiraceae bacterium]|nr:hypothetical protein [Oscillospiraceae bacterium]